MNGERVQWALLRPGDHITLGTFGLRVALVASTSRQPVPQAGTDDETTEETSEEWGQILRGPNQFRP